MGSYYYSVLPMFGFLGARREGLGAALCALAAVSGLIAKLVCSTDVRYMLMSAATLGFVVVATAGVAMSTRGPDPA